MIQMMLLYTMERSENAGASWTALYKETGSTFLEAPGWFYEPQKLYAGGEYIAFRPGDLVRTTVESVPIKHQWKATGYRDLEKMG